MKIISKYKDYYDYLTSIWGEDEKKILDRRVDITTNLGTITNDGEISIHFCNQKYSGLVINGEFYWGEDLLKVVAIVEPKHRRWFYGSENFIEGVRYGLLRKRYKPYMRSTHGFSFADFINIDPEPSAKNIENDCPIIGGKIPFDYNEYPFLGECGFPTIMPPEDAYKKLDHWLSEKMAREEVEVVIDNDTLIESKGMDVKRSFRPNMKS